MKYMKWIGENLKKWYKICKVKNQEFEKREIETVLEELVLLALQNDEFGVILMVFLTEYEKELPFLSDDKE